MCQLFEVLYYVEESLLNLLLSNTETEPFVLISSTDLNRFKPKYLEKCAMGAEVFLEQMFIFASIHGTDAEMMSLMFSAIGVYSHIWVVFFYLCVVLI